MQPDISLIYPQGAQLFFIIIVDLCILFILLIIIYQAIPIRGINFHYILSKWKIVGQQLNNMLIVP
jgi:hypothetical protein